MKCEICNKKEAVIHVQQIMGSSVYELHLCEDCAKAKGIAAKNDDIKLSLQDLLLGLVDFRSEGQKNEASSCPSCGMTYIDFRKGGRVGCTGCFAAFQKDIASVFGGKKKTILHAGKYPEKLRVLKTLLIDREELKLKLDEAVKQENYEVAAALRDRIEQLERGGEEEHV
jgi:protein arginine kinase activator